MAFFCVFLLLFLLMEFRFKEMNGCAFAMRDRLSKNEIAEFFISRECVLIWANNVSKKTLNLLLKENWQFNRK